jgi:hypothetical protein
MDDIDLFARGSSAAEAPATSTTAADRLASNDFIAAHCRRRRQSAGYGGQRIGKATPSEPLFIRPSAC